MCGGIKISKSVAPNFGMECHSKRGRGFGDTPMECVQFQSDDWESEQLAAVDSSAYDAYLEFLMRTTEND